MTTHASGPVVVLGMHRSGTSCLAGMLVAHGLTPPGTVVRNWDNARGHFESTAAVRLNEAVLAHSGGHWLSPPSNVRWTADQAAERDALLTQGDHVVKDPRTLLTLPFWRASPHPMRFLGIVRAPLAVARSLSSWRQMAMADGLALWQAHNAALLQAHGTAGPFPLLDFDQPEADFLAAAHVALTQLGVAAKADVLRQSYVRELVHHDAHTDTRCGESFREMEDLHAQLRARCLGAGQAGASSPSTFPWPEIEALRAALQSGDTIEATIQAQRACTTTCDLAAVAVPVIADVLRAGHAALAGHLLTGMRARLPPALSDLLAGKIALAGHDAVQAVSHLQRACAVTDPFWEARQLLPQALRRAGQHDAARAAQIALVPQALYPHGVLATLAEWAWADGESDIALDWSQQAIIAAPMRRRGRLRARRAVWLRQRGDALAAERELATALAEDPGYFTGKRRAIRADSASDGSPSPSIRSAGGDNGGS